MESIGVVVNPIAGMGGRVGLKGTDGKLEAALQRGAEPRAPSRAREALESLAASRSDVRLYTGAGVLGAQAARDAGFDPTVIYEPDSTREASDPASTEATSDPSSIDVTAAPAEAGTTAADTRAVVAACLEYDVDLVLFVGGDGTAVDVAETIEDAGAKTPMLGVPAGVKIYSSVFAVTPNEAGRIAAEFERTEPREVTDIDEAAYREGEVRTTLRAVVPVPVSPAVQSSKQLAGGSVDALAAGFARDIDPDRTYVFGPGGTVGRIEDELGIDASPLGIDVWRDGELIVRDAAESEILSALASPATIVVSPIGGQGFVFGRGNHQLSPAVIRGVDEIEIVASPEKIDGIGTLRVDTGDTALDEALRGWRRVRTGRFTTRLVEVV
ncbi:ATP-NAD kinase family protein [Halobacteria archaeon AArc-dxtr1]|nr:ATP-NAD kinase family protein [Halobacteria archaeon AArc-dxtr1]